ncbi:uncharacterized protein BXZ73DRAFT_105894 [Epithele typhae]|uniref:uncharacterized protein n=1 Tax=Epithele typhae TaxID=378194 RepID=UPI00200841C3|nr:uncharacterized protein BXZ73DRAFT_105894 [Epithele typhae]KAH9916265.1 hypothetical protein BXZ73DRAFT_105894 [Epithele typhae]
MDAFFVIASPIPVDEPTVEDILVDRETGSGGDHSTTPPLAMRAHPVLRLRLRPSRLHASRVPTTGPALHLFRSRRGRRTILHAFFELHCD